MSFFKAFLNGFFNGVLIGLSGIKLLQRNFAFSDQPSYSACEFVLGLDQMKHFGFCIQVADSLEKGTEHEDEYMISEKELLVNR